MHTTHISEKRIYSYLSHFLVTILGIIILVSANACNCFNKGIAKSGQDDLSPDLINSLEMEAQPDSLIGSSKNVEVIFTLDDGTNSLSLKGCTLKAMYVVGNGQLEYLTYNGVASYTKVSSTVDEELANLTTLKELTSANSPLKVSFNLVPEQKCTEAKVKFELVNKDGKVLKTAIANWEHGAKLIDIQLVGPTNIQGGASNKLHIVNKNNQPTETGKLKLKIIRSVGSEAVINDSVLVSENIYEVNLGVIPKQADKFKTICITNSGKDLKAEFQLQLVYDGVEVGNPLSLTWEKGISVQLKDIVYNKSTGHVTYTVENNGSEPLTGLQLKCINKTSGIKLGGSNLVGLDKETIINIADSLVPGQKIEKKDLGELEFGTNKQADFEFSLLYKDGYTPLEPHTFVQVGIQLDLKINHNADNKVTYILDNIGEDIAKNVKISYKTKNSLGPTLDGKQEGGTAEVDIAADNGQQVGEWALDFNNQDRAVFEFTVTCNDSIISQLTTTKIFLSSKVDLELQLESSKDLALGEKEIKLKIVPRSGSIQLEELDFADFEILVQSDFTKLPVGEMLSVITNDMKQVDHSIKFSKSDALYNTIILHLNDKKFKSKTSKNNFTFELKYKNKRQGEPLEVTWNRGGAIQLKVYENTKTNTFYHYPDICLVELIYPGNNQPVNIENLSLELKPKDNSKATFAFIDINGDLAGNLAPVSQLVKSNTILKSRGPFRIKLVDSNSEPAGTVKILLKRNNIVIYSSEVQWVFRDFIYEVQIDFKPTFMVEEFGDYDIIDIVLANIGDKIYKDSVNLQIINDKNIDFRVSSGIEEFYGNNINQQLSAFTDGEEINTPNLFLPQASLVLHLGRDLRKPLPNDYAIPIQIIVTPSDIQGQNIKTQRQLIWYNFEKIKQEIEVPFEIPLQEAQKSYNLLKERLNKGKTIPSEVDRAELHKYRRQAIDLKQKAEQKLKDENDLLPERLKKRINFKIVEPAEYFIQSINDCYEQFWEVAKQEMDSLLKKFKTINQVLVNSMSRDFKLFSELTNLLKKLEEDFNANKQLYDQAERWLQFKNEYEKLVIDENILLSLNSKEALTGIDNLWAELQTDFQFSYEKVADFYLKVLDLAKPSPENISINIADNTLIVFRKFCTTIASNVVPRLQLPAIEKVALIFEHTIHLLLYAVNSPITVIGTSQKEIYVNKMQELVNHDLFKALEKVISDKTSTLLTKTLLDSLNHAKSALNLKKLSNVSREVREAEDAINQIDARIAAFSSIGLGT